MDFWIVTALNGLSYGLLLFMLSAGLTVVFGMMGVLNFAHAAFYMLGAYVGHSLNAHLGFVWALLLAPPLVGLLGAALERWMLRRLRAHGHVPELLLTFGVSYVVLELVRLIWGPSSVAFVPPLWLQGSALTLVQTGQGGLDWVWGTAAAGLCSQHSCAVFPILRAVWMGVALLMLLTMALVLSGSRLGWIVRACLTHPHMVQALGHDVPRIHMGVFALGTTLAALAGVLGGSTFVTEPGMAASMGALVFVVVVVGGLGSLGGALIAALALGMVQTWASTVDVSLAQAWSAVSFSGDAVAGAAAQPSPHLLARLTLAQLAPSLPFLLMVLVLVWRPQGLFGKRLS
jgi:branched-chain amino acid transport system permease protein